LTCQSPLIDVQVRQRTQDRDAAQWQVTGPAALAVVVATVAAVSAVAGTAAVSAAVSAAVAVAVVVVVARLRQIRR
jgi:hypothetical protein